MDREVRALFDSLHQQTMAATAQDLALVTSLPELLAVTQAGLQHLSKTVHAIRDQAGVETACAAGCSFCCWNRIDAPAHEVLLIARYLRARGSEEELTAVRTAARARHDADRGMDYAARQTHMRPCVLLLDGVCSVYQVRPGACRRYFSGSVEACHRLWQDPRAEAAVETPLLHDAGRAVGTAVRRAFVEAGYDPWFYDFQAGLAEALEDEHCEQRWFEKREAFSAAARTLLPPQVTP